MDCSQAKDAGVSGSRARNVRKWPRSGHRDHEKWRGEIHVLICPLAVSGARKKRSQGKLRLLAGKLGGCWYCLLSWEGKRRELERVWGRK